MVFGDDLDAAVVAQLDKLRGRDLGGITLDRVLVGLENLGPVLLSVLPRDSRGIANVVLEHDYVLTRHRIRVMLLQGAFPADRWLSLVCASTNPVQASNNAPAKATKRTIRLITLKTSLLP